MLKSAVIGSGVDKACQTKLFYVSQALKPWVLDYVINQIARYAYKSIDWIVDNFPFICFVSHLKVLSYKSRNLFLTKFMQHLK